METVVHSENPVRSGFYISKEPKTVQSTDFRAGRHGKMRLARNRVWRGMVFAILLWLAAELCAALGITADLPFSRVTGRLLTAISTENSGRFQQIASGMTVEWITDSLPLCGYSCAAAGTVNGGTQNEKLTGYLAAALLETSDTSVLKYAALVDRTAAVKMAGQGEKAGGESGCTDADAAEKERDGGAGQSGTDEAEEGDGEAGQSGIDEAEEGDGEAGQSGTDEAEEGDGEAGQSGTDEAEEGDGEDSQNGKDKEESDGETGSGDQTSRTMAGIFTMPAVTGTLYSAQTLTYSFLASNFYNISSSTVVYESELNGDLLAIPLALTEITEEPQILIYHTHSHEFFADSDTSDLSTGIVGVGDYLAELLEGYGYSVLHLTDQFDYVDGVLDRSNAYTYAGTRLKEVLAEYPSIEVMIDLHRDGVDDSQHFVTEINGKSTAMIMFFNGMSRTTSGDISYLPNANLKENLAFSLQLKVKAEAYYPGFTRKTYIRPYRYNLHLLEKSLLIEAGAQTNTYEEVKNAMEPLAVLLYIQLSGLE